MGNVLVLEALQSMDKVNTCWYSLLKYLEVYNLNPPATTSVFVYTDRPAFFESFIPFFHRFQIKEVPQTQLNEWQGKHPLPERVNIEILLDVLAHQSGNVLFLDSNTFTTAPLENVFKKMEEGHFLLHSHRRPMNNSTDPELAQLERFLAQGSIEQDGQKLTIGQLRIWNSYAIGLNRRHKAVVEDALRLINLTYMQFPHAAVIPFALSHCFQKTGVVSPAADCVYHYGKLKEFHQLLHLFFKKNQEESISNLVKRLHVLDAPSIQKQKNRFQALPFYKKWLQIMTGKNWNIKQYEKKI